MEKAFAYDDILLVPKRSPVDSRSNVSLETQLADVSLTCPVTSAPMDTVTEKELAQALTNEGGLGFIHRFLSIDEQIAQIKAVDGKVAGTIGVEEDYVTNAKRLYNAGADIVCLDIAHGHLNRCLEATEKIVSEHPEITLCVGNVATKQGVFDLIQSGADIVKVGIGSGSHCLTREVTGVGVPQFTAIREATKGIQKAVEENLVESENEIGVIADGGIQTSGDISKALMAGADAIMAGGLFASCKEAPGKTVIKDGVKYRQTRGMASEEAREERDGGEETTEAGAVEGAECLTEVNSTVSEVIQELSEGISSALSYCGGHNIQQARENSEFKQVTHSTNVRNGVHGEVDSIRKGL